MASTTSTRSGSRTRPWSDAEVRAADWNSRDRPIKSLACAARYPAPVGGRQPQRYERRGPDHRECVGTSHGPCACNCHFEWYHDVDLVRLRDGRVGVVVMVDPKMSYTLGVNLGQGRTAVVDIGEPVLLDQQGDE